MIRNKLSNLKFRLPPQGLLMQLIAIVLLPLTLILLVITFGSITVHQNAMRTMVGERDARVVSTAARAMSAQIDLKARDLSNLAVSIPASSAGQFPPVFSNARVILEDFDHGLALYNRQGRLLDVYGSTRLWESFSADPTFTQVLFAEITARPGQVVVINTPEYNSHTSLVAHPSGENFLVGAFLVSSLVESMLGDILPANGQMSVMVLDARGQQLYQSGNVRDYSQNHGGVAEALAGQSGTFYVNYNGDEHVTAYSPIPSSGWVLITEESWETVSTPTLRMTQAAPLLLVPALLIMLFALWLGARQIIRPLRELESRAARLAWGDFAAIQEPVGGIAEIGYLQTELVGMARKVQEAQRSLHGYIGSITAAQEEERRRLARELHDDTLQALIALKQRVQLAQLELHPAQRKLQPAQRKLQPAVGSASTQSVELEEIAVLTEKTIENLRRLTHALRPIYLEDLGLVPALEMLARETGQAMGIPVDFQRQGVERRLDGSVELALYRMAQEALNNIARHAQASRAAVSLAYTPSAVSLQVEDDGAGFDLPASPGDFASFGHYGLLGLHERAELIGATLNIRTAPGKGTSLTVTLQA